MPHVNANHIRDFRAPYLRHALIFADYTCIGERKLMAEGGNGVEQDLLPPSSRGSLDFVYPERGNNVHCASVFVF